MPRKLTVWYSPRVLLSQLDSDQKPTASALVISDRFQVVVITFKQGGLFIESIQYGPEGAPMNDVQPRQTLEVKTMGYTVHFWVGGDIRRMPGISNFPDILAQLG